MATVHTASAALVLLTATLSESSKDANKDVYTIILKLEQMQNFVNILSVSGHIHVFTLTFDLNGKASLSVTYSLSCSD